MSALQIATLTVGIPIWIVGLVVAAIGIFTSMEMMVLVDAKRPADRKRMLQWNAGEALRGLWAEYQSLYPNGRLGFVSSRCLWIGTPMFFAGGLLFYFGVGLFS